MKYRRIFCGGKGGNDLKGSLLMLDSYTVCRRAVRYLASLGIKATVEKSIQKGGCAYGIRVWESPEKVCRLLSGAGIECKRIVM